MLSRREESRSNFLGIDADDMLVPYGSLGDRLRLANVDDKTISGFEVSETTLTGNESRRSFFISTGDVASGLKAKDLGGQAETDDGDVL